MVAVKAMMMGAPTIRSSTAGAYDMITHKIYGYIFENRNINELSTYIDLLVESEEHRYKVGKNGKNNAIEKLTEDKMIEDLERVYRKII